MLGSMWHPQTLHDLTRRHHDDIVREHAARHERRRALRRRSVAVRASTPTIEHAAEFAPRPARAVPGGMP